MQPRGIRNNNPLNIRHSADQWQGACEEQKDKSFVQFKTMAYGYRAAWKTLQSYYNRFYMQGIHGAEHHLPLGTTGRQQRHRGVHPQGTATEQHRR